MLKANTSQHHTEHRQPSHAAPPTTTGAPSNAGSSAPTSLTVWNQITKQPKKWDEEFVKIEQGPLFDLILDASYLETNGLLDITCQKVAGMIKGKTPEQIRKTFGIVNDFTKEEEDAIRKENAWAFED